MKHIYVLIIFIAIFLVSGCSASQIASPEFVINHVHLVQQFDKYDRYIAKKLLFLDSKKLIKDKELRQKLHDYNDAVYIYYAAALTALANGDVESYKQSLDFAWSITQMMEKLLDEIVVKVESEKKKEGLGL